MHYLRLKKQSDFDRLFKSGKRAFSPTFTLVYKPSDTPSIGISVGKRHGKSVQRNHIKRLVREAFRTVESEMKGTYTLVIVPKVCEEYSFHTFVKHLSGVIKKEKL